MIIIKKYLIYGQLSCWQSRCLSTSIDNPIKITRRHFRRCRRSRATITIIKYIICLPINFLHVHKILLVEIWHFLRWLPAGLLSFLLFIINYSNFLVNSIIIPYTIGLYIKVITHSLCYIGNYFLFSFIYLITFIFLFYFLGGHNLGHFKVLRRLFLVVYFDDSWMGEGLIGGQWLVHDFIFASGTLCYLLIMSFFIPPWWWPETICLLRLWIPLLAQELIMLFLSHVPKWIQEKIVVLIESPVDSTALFKSVISIVLGTEVFHLFFAKISRAFVEPIRFEINLPMTRFIWIFFAK